MLAWTKAVSNISANMSNYLFSLNMAPQFDMKNIKIYLHLLNVCMYVPVCIYVLN